MITPAGGGCVCCFTPEGVLLYTNPWCVAVHNRQIAPRPRCSEDSSTAMNPRFGVQDSGSLITAARIGVSRSLLPGRVVCCLTPEVVSLHTRGCVALHQRLCRFTHRQVVSLYTSPARTRVLRYIKRVHRKTFQFKTFW